MRCHSNPSTIKSNESNPDDLTSEQLMDQLYPRVFSTFVSFNSALKQRAEFYRYFFKKLNKNTRNFFESESPLQILEVGSGTGIGSGNNAKILKDQFDHIHYVAIDKRKKLVDMTRNNLNYALGKTSSTASVHTRDGLHGITQKELRSLGFKDGLVHVYFAEHSTYSELYDLNKSITYLNELKSILKPYGIAFIVVQTEHAEIQKLVARNVGTSSHYSHHVINLDNAIKMLNMTIVKKYLNSANLAFPRISNTDWESIADRSSNLYCYPNKDVKKVTELMTFIKNPLNCLNSTELPGYVETLKDQLNRNENKISIDEYIYAVASGNCPDESSDKSIEQTIETKGSFTETQPSGASRTATSWLDYSVNIVSGWFDYLVSYTTKQAAQCAVDCPSYFPKSSPNYWKNGGSHTPLLFKNTDSLHSTVLPQGLANFTNDHGKIC